MIDILYNVHIFATGSPSCPKTDIDLIYHKISVGNWPRPNVFLADLADWPMAKMAKMAKIGRSFIIITIISFFYEFKLLTLFCYNKWHLIINFL